MRCEITWADEEAHVQIKTDYIDKYVKDLKHEIPCPYRKWDESKKVWVVHTDYLEKLRELIPKYYDDVIDYSGVVILTPI
jgi:hypothetical protein